MTYLLGFCSGKGYFCLPESLFSVLASHETCKASLLSLNLTSALEPEGSVSLASYPL